MKLRSWVILGTVVLVVILLANGIVSRASTEAEAREWAAANLQDRIYTSSYTTEKTMYDEQGIPMVVDVPDGAVVTIHWSGGLSEKNDEWGKNWCFKMQLIINNQVTKNEEDCRNLARNAITGALL